MILKQTLVAMELLDCPHVNGAVIKDHFEQYQGIYCEVNTVHGEKGKTDFVQIIIPGLSGKLNRGSSPTLGVIGRLGGIGARPSHVGLVSDADGAVAAIATALKLADMYKRGDRIQSDVIITTHICPDAPTFPHKPVDFMDSPVSMAEMNHYEVDQSCDAIISIDTTKGNRIINHKGIALSPTVLKGAILHVSDDLIRIVETCTGHPAVTFPLSMLDITPYGNGLYHINSILQPAVAAQCPVVGLAITSAVTVPGCATGASHASDIALAASVCVETAKQMSAGNCKFFCTEQFEIFSSLYGSMQHLQG
ncbi:DUF1177 domain-containing protein [Vibrio sinensis]|uniref:DUF1177 domain-containing protein n=1 Tax=Vibrio sinensis TaxID=2302434 RepID=A0A3A6R2U3_9VIBR|nr:DUF1177 domain-containing protein [Vibrio sinensis]RJX75664.1 DUF1177 domain-containing protein [Vibrio sinensis]